MSPANEFPGNLIYAALFFGFVGFFLYSAGIRFRWFTKSAGVNRFDRIVERTIGMVPFLLGNSRVARRSTPGSVTGPPVNRSRPRSTSSSRP